MSVGTSVAGNYDSDSSPDFLDEDEDSSAEDLEPPPEAKPPPPKKPPPPPKHDWTRANALLTVLTFHKFTQLEKELGINPADAVEELKGDCCDELNTKGEKKRPAAAMAAFKEVQEPCCEKPCYYCGRDYSNDIVKEPDPKKAKHTDTQSAIDRGHCDDCNKLRLYDQFKSNWAGLGPKVFVRTWFLRVKFFPSFSDTKDCGYVLLYVQCTGIICFTIDFVVAFACQTDFKLTVFLTADSVRDWFRVKQFSLIVKSIQWLGQATIVRTFFGCSLCVCQSICNSVRIWTSSIMVALS